MKMNGQGKYRGEKTLGRKFKWGSPEKVQGKMFRRKVS
jgi:hypothetical protein